MYDSEIRNHKIKSKRDKVKRERDEALQILKQLIEEAVSIKMKLEAHPENLMVVVYPERFMDLINRAEKTVRKIEGKYSTNKTNKQE